MGLEAVKIALDFIYTKESTRQERLLRTIKSKDSVMVWTIV